MKEQFSDILSLDDVKGAIVLNTPGQIVFKSFNEQPKKSLSDTALQALATSLGATVEAELVYENIRLYVRKFTGGMVIIVMGRFALVSMVRLNCDILLPSLAGDAGKPKGLGRFFKR